MDEHRRIHALEAQVHTLRRIALYGIALALAASGVAIWLAVRTPSALAIGRVHIDGEITL
jgi:hypothetical protein